MEALGKKKTLLSYLARGVAMIHLDARRPGVVVPPRFQTDPHLRLNLSYRYAIPDFDVSDERVQATLSFGGVPFQCIVPWEAVFGITSQASGDGQVWPEDLPTEVVRSLGDKEEPAQKRAVPAPETRKPRPALVAVDGEAPPRPVDTPAPPAAEKPGPGEPPRRGHLRLVR
jgi:stringent starvation protein B